MAFRKRPEAEYRSVESNITSAANRPTVRHKTRTCRVRAKAPEEPVTGFLRRDLPVPSECVGKVAVEVGTPNFEIEIEYWGLDDFYFFDEEDRRMEVKLDRADQEDAGDRIIDVDIDLDPTLTGETEENGP